MQALRPRIHPAHRVPSSVWEVLAEVAVGEEAEGKEMTDIQLAILLRQYHQRLTAAISELEQQLPDTMKQTIKSQILPYLPSSTSYPVTDNLWSMANDIEVSADKLESSG